MVEERIVELMEDRSLLLQDPIGWLMGIVIIELQNLNNDFYLNIDLFQEDRSLGQISVIIQSIYRGMLAGFYELVCDLQDDNVIRNDINPSYIVDTFRNLVVSHMIKVTLLREEPVTTRELKVNNIEEFVTIFWQGISRVSCSDI